MRLAPRPATQRDRRRDERGMTLLETVLALSLSVMMVVPMLGWAQFAFGEQAASRTRSLDASGLGLLRTALTRDLTNADAAWTSGSGLLDCTGGEGAGGTVLLAVGDGSFRQVYSLAGSGPSLWRRVCGSPGGPVAMAEELAGPLLASGTSVECLAGATADGGCRRVNLRVTTGSLEQASITGTVRSEGAQSGTFDPLLSERAPAVVVTATPTSTTRGQTVAFSSEGTTDPSGSEMTYDWDFGDGTRSAEANPTKAYTSVGRYSVVLTVTNAEGVPSTGFVVVDVTNHAPEAVIAAPETGTTVHRGEVIDFSSEGSNDDEDADVGGQVVSYLWDFGDGTTSTEAEPEKAYTTLSPTAGFTVRLTVTDDQGATNQAQIKVVVVNRKPTVSITATPPSGAPPLAVTLTADVVDEPDLGAGAPPLTYSWKLGDGTTSTTASPRVTYSTTGTKTVELTVTDDAGETATASKTINVTRLPVAAFTVSPASGRAPLTVTFSNTTSDPDGNATSWAWNFGDGGTSTARNPGSRTFTHNVGSSDTFTGATYTVRLSVTDRFGNTTTADQVVTVAGSPVPTSLRAGRSGTTVTYRWTKASPNVSGYQVNVDFPGSCTDRLITVSSGTATSTAVNYGGTTSTTCSRQTQYVTIRSRDTNTGKWGAWSAQVRFN